MQKAFLQTLYDLADKDKNVLMLSADNGIEFDKLFKREFPRQYIEFGIAECNMVGAAAGLASCGKIPFMHTAGIFLAYRAYEFIRNDVCVQNLNVKIIGFGSGLANSTLGPSHHSTEDIGVLNPLPNLTILSACSPSETEKAILQAYAIKGPVYIRIGLVGEPEIEQKMSDSLFERNNILLDGTDVAIFSTGPILTEVLAAIEMLQKQGISARVVNVNKIKPFHKESLIEICSGIQKLVTVEEHNVHGGLGSIISDIMVQEKINANLLKIGLSDCFATGYGSQQDLQKANGLDRTSIYESILALFKK